MTAREPRQRVSRADDDHASLRDLETLSCPDSVIAKGVCRPQCGDGHPVALGDGGKGVTGADRILTIGQRGARDGEREGERHECEATENHGRGSITWLGEDATAGFLP